MTAFDKAWGVVKRGFPEPRGPFDHPKDPESIPDWWLDMTPEEQDAFVESERQTAEEQRMVDEKRSVVKNLTHRPLDNTTFRPFVGDPYELECVMCGAPATFAVDCKKHPLDPRQIYEGTFCADHVNEAVCGECTEEEA